MPHVLMKGQADTATKMIKVETGQLDLHVTSSLLASGNSKQASKEASKQNQTSGC